MKKKVVVISTSLRKGGNSDVLADACSRGAKESEHSVEKVVLYDKTVNFCKGCLACQNLKNRHCIMQDDADAIVQKMAEADVLVFATPIYFYEMCGQMKTLLDRTNPLFPMDYAFTDIYLITTAAEADKSAMDGAIRGLQGWIDCFEKAKLKGVLYGTNVTDMNDILNQSDYIEEAYTMGKNI